MASRNCRDNLLMHLDEIATYEVQSKRVHMVLDLFAETFGQAGKAAHVWARG